MASGVPIVGIPLQPEQDLNVHLAERQGMAIRLAPRLAGGAAMTNAVRALLGQPRYREQAMYVCSIVSRVDGASGAAAAICHYLAQQTGASPTPAALCPAS
jgi:UDP:flavonoid glycosyltransferase YjiC (YdhE family)